MNPNIIEQAKQIIQACDTAYFGVIDDNGYPSVSAISPTGSDGIFEVYFSTGLAGNKVRRLKNNKPASMCYCKDGTNVTLVGDAEVLTDEKIKHDMWKDWFKDIYTGGPSDPNYCIIKLTTKRVSLWIDDDASEFNIDDALTVTSRCGLMCNGCTYKASHNCGGCIETNGHPFYGECPIALCCQDKGFTHCGECPDMPCEQLHAYSCDGGEHSDKPPGARLELLKCWAKRSTKA